MESILHKCDETSSKVRLIHKDGSAVLLEIEHESIYDTTKKFVGYEGSARDITLIDEMKTELDDRSRYMNTITGSLKAGVVIISRDHSIVWLNDIARELFPAHANKKCYKALYSSGQTCDSCIFKDNIKYKDEKRLIKIDNQNNENLYPEYEVLTFPMNKDNGKVDEIIELFMPVKAAKAEKEDVAVNDINLAGKPVNNSPSSSSSSQLCEMNDLLRSCVNTREASRIVSRYLPRLFPNLAGTIFLYKSQVNLFEPAVSWGKYNRNPGAFSPETCTAIRRGKKILVDNEENEEACEHMGQETTLNYAEIPMIFQGEYVGLLHLQNQSQELQNTDRNDEAVNNNIVLLAQVVADQIAVVLTSIKLREAFQEQNKHDPVTGFFNRKYMEQMLEREISLATGSGRQIGVIILSLENFNEFTESRGYQNSDFVLQNFGVLLKNGCSPEDIICRCDGNKFAVVVPNSSADHIKGRAMALHEISKLINIGDKQPSSAPLHLSLGIALHPDHGASAEDVIKSAYSSLQTNRKKLESLKESNLNNIREAVKQR
jgi:diguanylate cyclase (GGDEF)-like protein